MARRASPPLHTPDGRYIVVRGRLWRAANPFLAADVRAALVQSLMTARRDVRRFQAEGDVAGLRAARARVHAAKVGLGERGPVWWKDGAPDLGRRMIHNTEYAEWYLDRAAELAQPGDPPIQLVGVT